MIFSLTTNLWRTFPPIAVSPKVLFDDEMLRPWNSGSEFRFHSGGVYRRMKDLKNFDRYHLVLNIRIHKYIESEKKGTE